MLSFVIFPAGLATSRETATTAGATVANAGDEGQTRRRRNNSSSRRRRHVRRAGKRGRPMTQPTQPTPPTDNAQPRDAGQREDETGQKRVDVIDEAGKKQPPVPRQPRRRYDPVLQPPEKTRVP